MITLRRGMLALSGGAAVLALTASPAGAHINPSPDTAPAGSYFLFQLVVPHGCEEAPTTEIEVKIPDTIESVTPQVVAGWTITRNDVPLDPPVDDGEGGTITERTASISWEGGPLAPDELEQFGLSVKLPDTPGEALSFPVIQTCGDQQTDWIEIPVEGEEEPEHPAPTITLTESAGEHGHGDAEEAEEAEDDTTTTTEATATDDADSSSNALGVVGAVLGAAGLATGGVALSRSRRTPAG